MERILRFAAAATVMASCACSHEARAQDAATPPPVAAAPRPAEAATGVGDIIVTARRVEERLQDVPISITTFNGKQLADRHVTDANDLVLYTPSLSATSIIGRDQTQYAIRGFTQQNRTTASVAVYFADAPAPRGGGANPAGDGAGPGSFFDLQNVQVLKGPQGTLFGRNTTGGAVLLVPQKPTGTLGGYVEGLYGSYDWKGLQGVLNVPLSDNARMRLGVDYQNRDGFTRSVGVGPDLDNRNYISARASFDVDVTPSIENYTIFTYIRSKTHGSTFLPATCDPSFGLVAYLVCGTPGGTLAGQQAIGPRRTDADLADPTSGLRQYGVINTTTWKAGDALTIKNVFSYTRLRATLATDLYGTNIKVPATLPVALGPVTLMQPTAPYTGLPISFIDLIGPANGVPSNRQSTLTEELQFQGNAFADRLSWQAGAYFESSRPLGRSGKLNQQLLNCSDPYKFQCVDPLGAAYSAAYSAAFGVPVGVQVGGLNQTFQESTYRDIGVYAQGTYALTDRIKLTGGIRYTTDKATGTSIGTVYRFPQPNTPVAACIFPSITTLARGCALKFGTKSHAPTWLIDIDYKPDGRVLLYAKYARGYRQGSVSADAAPGFEVFKPERVDAYETGAKTQFAAGDIHGVFNVAGFYNRFKDQQISAIFNFADTSIAPDDGIVNAGRSRIYGAEIETTIIPARGLDLTGSYTYLNTKVLSLEVPVAPAPVPLATVPAFTASPSVVPGGRLIYSPRNKFTASATYTLRPLPVGRISAGVTYTYVSRQLASVASPIGQIPSYALVNVNLEVRGVAGSPIDASLFMTNLTNRRYAQQPAGLFPGAGFDGIVYGEPRMIGGRLRASF